MFRFNHQRVVIQRTKYACSTSCRQPETNWRRRGRWCCSCSRRKRKSLQWCIKRPLVCTTFGTCPRISPKNCSIQSQSFVRRSFTLIEERVIISNCSAFFCSRELVSRGGGRFEGEIGCGISVQIQRSPEADDAVFGTEKGCKKRVSCSIGSAWKYQELLL